jgi:hypothetical protein
MFSKKGGFLIYVEDGSHGYNLPSGAFSCAQFGLPVSIFAYTSQNNEGITYFCSTACISLRRGHISWRYTGFPSAEEPEKIKKMEIRKEFPVSIPVNI